jgi:DNA-directed RNA polymerase subunit M/transcription elongation factor TFIIS
MAIPAGYCPKCGSKLYPADEKYMAVAGVCSSCVTYDDTPDKRFKSKFYDEEGNWRKDRKRRIKAKSRIRY